MGSPPPGGRRVNARPAGGAGGKMKVLGSNKTPSVNSGPAHLFAPLRNSQGVVACSARIPAARSSVQCSARIGVTPRSITGSVYVGGGNEHAP